MKKKLWYMAHPVRPIEGETLEGNIASGQRHLAALCRRGVHVIAPWIGLCESLDDTNAADRDHGMAIDMLSLSRCDGLILVGDRFSCGMIHEENLAEHIGLEVVNLIGVSLKSYPTCYPCD